jgi:hypothetical protein
MIYGPPGRYVITCEPTAGAQFGYGPEPRVSGYIFLGLVGGGAAVAMAIASFVILLVTLLRRRARRTAASGLR